MPRKIQVSPSIRWAFTFNNYPSDWRSSVVPLIDREAKAYVIGEEVGESGTPHLQGYVEWSRKLRPLSLGLDKSIHWEKAKKNAYVNANYCSKDGNYMFKNLDIEEMRLATIEFNILRPWQKAISALVAGREDPRFGRTIYWFWEPRGDFGKSILAAHLVDCRKAIMVGGKNSDAKCAVADYKNKNGFGPRLVIIDVPRRQGARVSYTGIEEIKNGLFFSSKYESGMCRYNRPHVVVFANLPPEVGDSMSPDRWKVCCLSRHVPLMKEIRGE